MVYRAYIERNKDILRLQNEEELSQQKAERKSLNIFEITKELTEKYLLITGFGSPPRPFNWLIKLRSYGLKIRANYSTEGTIEWNKNKLNIFGISFSISQLQRFSNGLISSIETRLLSELLLVTGPIDPNLPRIPLDLLRDNPRETRPE